MEDTQPFFLQSRAVILWLQGRKWNELIPSDFITIMPIKHFNDLERPIRLKMDAYPYIYQKLSEIISMWVDHKNWGYKPSDFREDGKIYTEDLRAFEMLETMFTDAEKYKAAKAEGEQRNRQYIESEQAKFRQSKGRGR
jgi:hypothetical protein